MRMKDPLMTIKDIKGSAKMIGKDICRQRSLKACELKDFITLKEVIGIIKECAVKENEEYLVNMNILSKITSEIHSWIDGIVISRLASKGFMDVVWDSDENVFKFLPKKDMQ
jgi:hypothetical protein